jgi:hypothetical protein
MVLNTTITRLICSRRITALFPIDKAVKGYYSLLIMIRFERLPENIHQKMHLLSDILMKESNISFAYLFGGLLKKRRTH